MQNGFHAEKENASNLMSCSIFPSGKMKTSFALITFMAAINFAWAGTVRGMVDPYVHGNEVGDQVFFAGQGQGQGQNQGQGRNNDSDGGHSHSQGRSEGQSLSYSVRSR